MYSSFQLIKKYLRYRITASNGKGHGIHSPFVYDFVEKVLNDKTAYPFYRTAEKRRRDLLRDHRLIDVEDFGAGSTVIKSKQRKVSAIAASSLKPKKYAQLLFRIVQYYKPLTLLELGTSFGISTSYMAAANPLGKVYTCEGSPAIAAIAKESFHQQDLQGIELFVNPFEESLPALLPRVGQLDFVFIDGNHRKEPTLHYFHQLLSHLSPTGMIIFDDIHWSAGMEDAWSEIKQHPSVTLTIDLFFIGIVFINKDFKVKQDFVVNY